MSDATKGIIVKHSSKWRPKLISINGQNFFFRYYWKKKKEKISKCCLSNLVFLKINFSKNLSPLIIRWSKLRQLIMGRFAWAVWMKFQRSMGGPRRHFRNRNRWPGRMSNSRIPGAVPSKIVENPLSGHLWLTLMALFYHATSR